MEQLMLSHAMLTGTRCQKEPRGPSQGAPAVPGSGNSGLDTGRLDCLVRSYFVKGLAPSTVKEYTCGQRRYLNFCVTAGLPAVPAGEDVLCKFAAALATEGLRHQTIKFYMAGVRYLHIEEGLGDPFLQSLPHLHYVLRGVKRSQGVAGRESLPITSHLLRQIKAVWDVNAAYPDYIMLWAACSLAFFALQRAGELTIPNDSGFDVSSHLAWGDIGVDNPKCPAVLSVRLKASKTDPFQKSITLYVVKGSPDICPVSAVLAF